MAPRENEFDAPALVIAAVALVGGRTCKNTENMG